MTFSIFVGTLGGSNIRKSTMERSALPSSQCERISDWYDDRMPDRWIYNESVLLTGMKYFYEKTGVQPYLVIVDNVNGNKYPTDTQFVNYLADVYDDVMPDGGHLVVGFLEGNTNDYAIACYAGKDAESVMDEEAREILLDYLDHYYTSDLDDEAYFSTVFTRTADKIMTVDTIKSAVWGKVLIVFLVVGGIAIVGVVIVKRRKHKAEQAKADAEILKTDLSGNPNGSDPLKDKYNV